jgi:CHRD domain
MGRRIGVVLAVATACATTSTTSPATSETGPNAFRVKLDPANEVPPPNLGSATPSGSVTFTVTGTSVSYVLTATGLTSPPIAAHIHTGAPGIAGPVIVPLTVNPGPTAGTANGEGSFDVSAIKGKNADGSPMTFQDLLNAMRSGGTYVNVHTAENKPGEIRGQIGS